MQTHLQIGELPDGAIEAAQAFAADWLGHARAALAGGADIVIALPDAPHDHSDWRRALARDLARAHAPQRVNVLGGGSTDELTTTLAYLERAPGVTGQYFQLSGIGSDG